MSVTYREIRIGELGDALAFAKGLGVQVERAEVCHELSLTVREDDETVGCAFCVGDGAGRYHVELALNEQAVQLALGKPIADTILRKMQAQGVGATRLHLSNQDASDRLWDASNWLDRIPHAVPGTAAETGEAEEQLEAADAGTEGVGEDESTAPSAADTVEAPPQPV